MTQEELHTELEKILETPDTGKYPYHSAESFLALINQHVDQAIGEDETREKTIDNETVYFYGGLGFKHKQYDRAENKRDELRAEQRRKAGL